jgi:hypothetical protein
MVGVFYRQITKGPGTKLPGPFDSLLEIRR